MCIVYFSMTYLCDFGKQSVGPQFLATLYNVYCIYNVSEGWISRHCIASYCVKRHCMLGWRFGCIKYAVCTMVNERIEYKLLSLTYKVLTTAQPSYLHNLISLQPPRMYPSSSVVTLSRPPPSPWKSHRSFSYASLRLWNQLPDSFHQPHHSRLDSPPHPLLNSSLSSSTLSSSITPSLFHSRVKTYLFNKSFPP